MHKLTKIVATISDKTASRSMLKSLYTAGMNLVRINTAHQKLETTLQVVQNVRSVSDKIAILLDTKGPEVRTTESKQDTVLRKGSSIIVCYGKDGSLSDDKTIFVNYQGFAVDVPLNARILISDGMLELKVNDRKRNKLFCNVLQGGVLSSNRNVNVPGVKLNTPSISARDRLFIEFAVKNNIEFIAHSMVRNKQDIIAVYKEISRLKGKVKVIAKIEDREGVRNIDSILEHAYGILIARGTLAVEMPPEQLIIVQKKIITKCIEKAKPVITATQMLLSMVHHPKPTRAEISDVANAIFDGTDAVMLSEETSIGKYPVLAVKMMSRIAVEVEKNRSMNISHTLKWNRPVQEFLIRNAALACKQIGLRAILVKTHSGSTALMASSFRAGIPVFAQCSSVRTMRELALVYGVFASVKSCAQLKKGNLIAVLGSSDPRKGADFLQIKTV